MTGTQDEQTARAMLIQNKYTDWLLRKPHVMGVGIGLAKEGGQPTNEVCLVVMVDQKVPPETLDPYDVIPPQLEGVRVDVQEIGVPSAY
jgi:hypothetical protein